MTEQSRLERSNASEFKTLQQIIDYCDTSVPVGKDSSKIYALPDIGIIAKTPELKANFLKNFTQPKLEPTKLKKRGASTILVIEPKDQVRLHQKPNPDDTMVPYNHGEVGTVIAQVAGNSLAGGDTKNHLVDSIYIRTSLNPAWRAKYDKDRLSPINHLVNNQGVAVINCSMGWPDNLLTFDKLKQEHLHPSDVESHLSNKEQEDLLWQVTAFLVDSTGNDGRFGENGNLNYQPEQKHNALSHLAPLVVHVGAAAKDSNGKWNIEGYSSANSPTFLAPVFPECKVNWKEEHQSGAKAEAEGITGTSTAANYASGVLGALNSIYGSYLTREQILYAVLATCDNSVTHVNSFGVKTPKPVDIEYTPNDAGLLYDMKQGYAGFGLVNAVKANKLLAHMVDMTQKPENLGSVTTPKQNTVESLDNVIPQPSSDGKYHYKVTPNEGTTGVALKTTLQAEFHNFHGQVELKSPNGTIVPMIMSRLHIADTKTSGIPQFGMSTTHAFAGEQLAGSWEIISTQPINKFRLMQDHFQSKDIVESLDRANIDRILKEPIPDLSHALPLHIDRPHAIKEPDKIYPKAAGFLKNLPSGFASAHRKKPPTIPFDNTWNGAELEDQARDVLSSIRKFYDAEDNDNFRRQAAQVQIAAAKSYLDENRGMVGYVPLYNAAHNYINCQNIRDESGRLNAEQAIEPLQRAITLTTEHKRYDKAFEASSMLYSALLICCENGKAEDYAQLLEQTRQQTKKFSQLIQGGVDEHAHRIGKGEFGYTDPAHGKIGSDDINTGVTIIVQDVTSKKTGLVHLNQHDDIESLDKFFDKFGDTELKVRIVGARYDNEEKKEDNILDVIRFLRDKPNVTVISADIFRGIDAPSSVVVDPASFTIEEKVPVKKNPNETAHRLARLITKKGEHLTELFDFSSNTEQMVFKPISEVVDKFIKPYAEKKEWEIASDLKAKSFKDIPLIVDNILELCEHIRANGFDSAVQVATAENQLQSVLNTRAG